ncbi:ArsR/SmtB family transcription factor [Fulvivirga ligni]|uniref:ArsR/SmtB family transcription factor n=1 Tax=Fulvivirga ligni TaxID=2904246 RepID=UPI001F3BC7A7|nr:metalloregulator ArsR/SmtB family transcription factor [Fulvivirga ligni]UII19149.1 metalloregulator ArsR/SmtB family transcription factor [Fulvivirga ligni]
MRRDVFQAIADPTRREIIHILSKAPLTPNDVAERFDISRPAISKHIKILHECALISIEQRGRQRICKARPEKLKQVSDWVAQYSAFWDEKLNALGRFLDENKD